jgi:gamma-glutamyl:cysteine ligase YbdK (ATP-grasp superfamily)
VIRPFPLRLFQALGVEIEYMIVDAESLDVQPIADRLIEAQAGAVEAEIEVGDVAWSNELALHVIELKTNGPAAEAQGLAARFQQNVARANELLGRFGARLLPTGMHPWMDPEREFRLWPHEHGPVYRAFHRIFDCRGHGWANLQSTHLNLPFGDDDEFGRLHAAIRLVLPLLPALAASSPLMDGSSTGRLDTRLHLYRGNARRVPSLTGRVIPEPVFTRQDYEGRLLQGIYDDLALLDPEGVLRHEWVNARGCIARFDRGAIEIRLLDVQECPVADLAVVAAATAAVRALCEGAFGEPEAARAWPVEPLAAILDQTVVEAGAATIRDEGYRRALGFPGSGPCSAAELWRHLVQTTLATDPRATEWTGALEVLLEEGCLARRILHRLGGDFRREALREVYGELADCLASGRLFRGRP